MVVRLVEADEFFIAQAGNFLWVSAAVVMISRRRVKMLTEPMPECGNRRAHGAFHFVEHHALVFQRAFWIFHLLKLKAMAFLSKIQWVKTWKEHRVEIDIQQVVEIFSALAGERVGRPITAGERVHKGIQRTAYHHEKWVAHWVALAAAKSCVL